MSDLTLFNVLLGPHITEKSTLTLESANRVVFRVARWSNKAQIKAAVEKLFSVDVLDVSTQNSKGKVKRFGQTVGKRADWKKAMVRLKEGQSIDFGAAG